MLEQVQKPPLMSGYRQWKLNHNLPALDTLCFHKILATLCFPGFFVHFEVETLFYSEEKLATSQVRQSLMTSILITVSFVSRVPLLISEVS